MGISDKSKNGKEEPPHEEKMRESKPSEEISEEIELPEDMLVKFNYCSCGALLDSTDIECWSCGKRIPIKGQKSSDSSKTDEQKVEQNGKEEAPPAKEEEEKISKSKPPIKKEEEPAEPSAHYARFIDCTKCGCLNEIYGAETICWSCNNIMDTSATFKELTKSIGEKEGESQQKIESAAAKALHSGKPLEAAKKKAITKYVLHCTKCNSWFVTNDYSFAMQCTSCGKKNVLYVSYTCENCKKFFDLNQNKKEKCPYCKKSLVLTNETALY